MAQTPETEVLYTGDGVTVVYQVPFPYMSPDEVFVSVEGVDVPFTLITSGSVQVQLASAPAVDTQVRVYRNTEAFTPKHLFASGTPFLPRYVDENATQLLYALQEGLDDFADVITDADNIARRSLRVPPDEDPIPPLANKAARANKVLGFNGDGNPVATLPQTGSGTELALDLATANVPGKGSAMIGHEGSTVHDVLEDHADQLADHEARLGPLEEVSGKVVRQDTVTVSGRKVPGTAHYTNYVEQFNPRPAPPGLALPFQVLGMRGDRVVVSKTAWQIMQAVATLPSQPTEGYVDNVGGANANTGTLVQPWQTLTYAVTQAAYTTKLTTGTHEAPLAYDRTAITGNRVRRIIGSGDPLAMKEIDDPNVTVFRIAGDDLTTKTWTLNSSAPILAQCTITSGLTVQAVVMTRFKDEFGRSRPLPLRASAADVATLGGWYFAAGVLYVRCGLNAQFDTTVKPYLKAVYTRSDSTGYVRHNGAEVYYENCAFVGYFPLADNAGGFPSKLVFKNCSFWYSRVSAVLATGGQIYLDNCELYRCRGDGLNSHANNGIECTHVTINTIARYCGDVDTLGTAIQSNENGMSMHENGMSAILGGSVYKASGPGLIDTGPASPTGTGVSWWYGVHSEDSQGVDPVNFDTYQPRTVFMESCSERGDSGVPGKVQTGATLRHGPNAIRGYTQTGTGILVPYVPLDPL